MNIFLEDKCFSLNRRNSNDEEEDEDDGKVMKYDLYKQTTQSKEERISFIASNIQSNCIQAESEVDESNTPKESQQQQQLNTSKSLFNNEDSIKEKKDEINKFNFQTSPNIDKKYQKIYAMKNGYESDNNEDQQLEDRSLRLCQFLLLLDNSRNQLFQSNLSLGQGGSLQDITSQYMQESQEKQQTNQSIKFNLVPQNVSMVIDTQEENQKKNSLTQQVEQIQSSKFSISENTQNDLSHSLQQQQEQEQEKQQEQKQQQQQSQKLQQSQQLQSSLLPAKILRSLSFNSKKKQKLKQLKQFNRAKSYDIDRQGDLKNPLKKKYTLSDYINHFISEKRQSLNPKNIFQKLSIRQQSWKDLDHSNPQEYKQLVRLIKKNKAQIKDLIELIIDFLQLSPVNMLCESLKRLQERIETIDKNIQMSINRGKNNGSQTLKQRPNNLMCINDIEAKKQFGLINLSSSISITDENLSCSENDSRSNTGSDCDRTPTNGKYNEKQFYQKSKFHHLTKKDSSESSQTYIQTQNIAQTALSFETNHLPEKNIKESVKKGSERIKKERRLIVILERLKKGMNDLIYIYNYYRVRDLIFMEEVQSFQNSGSCTSNPGMTTMFSSQSKKSFRVNKAIKFGDTIFSQHAIQDAINMSRIDNAISPTEKSISQFQFDENSMTMLRKKSDSTSLQQVISQREYISTDMFELSSQNNLCAQMMVSVSGNQQGSSKPTSDRYLPLYVLLKQIQSLDSYNKVISSNQNQINVLRQLENFIQAKNSCNRLKQKILEIKNIIITESEDFLEISNYLNQKYNCWKLKRWLTNFKKVKTIQQKAQLLDSMQNKKTICRICEKEVLMTNMKKHSINCKQLNDLNLQVKSQLKEMNSSLFYFFQQNRELQVQYTLIQKTLEKMVISQQILIESRNKNQLLNNLGISTNSNSPKSNKNSPRSNKNSPRSNKNSPRNGSDGQQQQISEEQQQQLLEQQQQKRRRNTCLNGDNLLNKLDFTSNSIQNQQNQQAGLHFMKLLKQNIDVNKEIMMNSECLPQLQTSVSDSLKQLDRSSCQIKSNNDFITQSDKVSKTIYSSKKITKNASIVIQQECDNEQSDNVFSNSLPNFHQNGRSNSSINTIQVSVSQINESHLNQSEKNNKLPDIIEEDTGCCCQTLGREECDKQDENDNENDEFKKIQNSNSQNDSDELNINKKEYLMNFEISNSQQLNGVPLITLNLDYSEQQSNSINQSNSLSTYSNNNYKESQNINKQNQFNQSQKKQSGQYHYQQGTLEQLDRSPNQDGTPKKEFSFEYKRHQQKDQMIINSSLKEFNQYNFNDEASPVQLGSSSALNHSFKNLYQSNDLQKKNIQDSKQMNSQLIASTDIRNIYHQNNSVNLNDSCQINQSCIKTSLHSSQGNPVVEDLTVSSQINPILKFSLGEQFNHHIHQYKIQSHIGNQIIHQPLQPITEQKGENDIGTLENNSQVINKKQSTSINEYYDNNNKQDKTNLCENSTTPYPFSSSSLSSSLSEVDLMVADFFKKIQLKNESERNFILQSNNISQTDDKNNNNNNQNNNNNNNNNDVINNQIDSQWGFSQEFTPRARLQTNLNNFLQQDTLNCIELQQSNILQPNSNGKSCQNDNNNDEKITSIKQYDDVQGTKFSNSNGNGNGNTGGCIVQRLGNYTNNNLVMVPSTWSITQYNNFVDFNSMNNLQSRNNIQEDSAKFTMTNIHQTNSANIIYNKSDISPQTTQNQQQTDQKSQQEGGLQTQIQPPKKIILQKLVSIDCQSANSSNSNLSGSHNTTKQMEVQTSNEIHKSSPKTENNPKEIVQKGSMVSLYSNQSRKSIRMNTIDIVTSDLSDCFHSNKNQNVHFQESESNNLSHQTNNSTSPSYPSRGGIVRQNSQSGNKLQKQKSIFSQKFSKQRSESLNQSDDDMYRSENCDQVHDLSNQKLMKIKQNNKMLVQMQLEQGRYEEEMEEYENMISNENNLTNKLHKKGHHHHHHHHHRHHNHNHSHHHHHHHKKQENESTTKTNTISINESNSTSTTTNNNFNNITEKTYPSIEAIDAKDLSYISKSSSSYLSSSYSEFSSSQSSNSEGSSSSHQSSRENSPVKEENKDIKNDKKKKKRKSRKSSKQSAQLNKRESIKKTVNQYNPIQQQSAVKPNMNRRQSLPLHLLLDIKNNGSKSSEIQKDIVELSTNFEIKIKEHEKYQCYTKLRITNIVQTLGKIFIIQDFKSTIQQKIQSLNENEKRIEFLLKKISLCTFKTKVQEIVQLFNERTKLIQKIDQIEKNLRSTIFVKEKKREVAGGEQSDHSQESEPKSPQNQQINQTKRRFVRSGTFKGSQENGSQPKSFYLDSLQKNKNEKTSIFNLKQDKCTTELSININNNNNNNGKGIATLKKCTEILLNRKKKLSQAGLPSINERRNTCQRINFDNMLNKQIEREEDSKIEKIDELLSKNNGYSSDGVLDNPYSSCGGKQEKDQKEKNSVGIKDFDFLKLISKGAFGRVWLVRKKNTEDIYAMKIVNFAEKMNKNHLDSLKKENDILSKVQGDYVVKAVYTFTHEAYICFVMEYMIGGDLGSIIQTYGVLEESVARFYIAEIVLAIHNLHAIGIIHRDLKPDNLLLDSQGHLKLTDFGLSDMGLQRRNKTTNEKKKAKLKIFNNLQKNKIAFQKQVEEIPQILTGKQKKPLPKEILEMKRNIDSLDILKLNNKANTKPANRIIGTPDYIAPEILRGEGLMNPAIDWWSVGVMLFELLIGIPPFNDDSVEKIFDNIKNFRIAWDEIPVGDGEDEVSQKSINLIKKLLHPDQKLRLGSQSIMQIQQDPFFHGIDWNNLKKMPAPIVPQIKNIFDTSNFDKDKVYQEGEEFDPFFGLPKGVDTVNEAKKMLDITGFSVKRYDVLFEENQKHIEKEEIQMQKMVKELEQQEKEIEQLENECGGDDSNDSSYCQDYDQIMNRSKAYSNLSNRTKASSNSHNKHHSIEITPTSYENILAKLKFNEDNHHA